LKKGGHHNAAGVELPDDVSTHLESDESGTTQDEKVVVHRAT